MHYLWTVKNVQWKPPKEGLQGSGGSFQVRNAMERPLQTPVTPPPLGGSFQVVCPLNNIDSPIFFYLA